MTNKMTSNPLEEKQELDLSKFVNPNKKDSARRIVVNYCLNVEEKEKLDKLGKLTGLRQQEVLRSIILPELDKVI